MLSGARARARRIRAAVMSLTVSAPSLSRTSRWTAHRTSQAQTRRTLSSAPSPTVGAIGWTLRRPRVPFAPSAHLPAGGARGFQGWEGGRGRPIIVRAAPATSPPSDAPASDDAPPMARGKKPARGGTRADPDPAANPSVAAASGPPVDILADDALGPDHARVRRWVVFSDLHLNRRTSRVCVDVLEAVHREAVARDAGIAFLGDFWHARGAIPVEPLIEALNAIRSWTRPCVMIPGNHDQVTAGGEVHALTPLAAANPSRVKIISRPTVWRNALWLPYRRDASVVKNAVEAAWSIAPTGEDGSVAEVRAVFCHADVVGASMNESFQARDGLDPSLFSPETDTGNVRIPVYTGHYHKPHTVPNTSITYVGSPYQVSRAEAGQVKALVVLDAENGWIGCDKANPDAPAKADPTVDPVTGVSPRARLPLDLGPRHYVVTGEDGDVPEGARAGDVIRWTLPLASTRMDNGTNKGTGSDDETNKPPVGIERARAAGIAVEISYETTSAPPRIPKAESLGPLGLYAAYAKAVDLPPDVVKLGKSVLEEVAANVAAADVDGTSARSSLGGNMAGARSPVQLSMHGVEVEGYGAFTDAVAYPLRDRGVCAVVGDNRDDGCSDSNGAGKTTLVMAAMWALTGNSDLRVEGGAGKTLTKTDVVNDYAKTARVRLEGAANGVPFWVERRVSRSKLLGLRYGVGDEERTLADSRLTQAAMDVDLGASVAARIAFHGQHTVGQLLDANDAALKAALGELVDADTWQEAKDLSRKRVTAARKRAAALGADASARADYVRRIEQRLSAATAAANDWTAQVERNLTRLAREEAGAADALGIALGAVVVAADALKAASARWDAEEADAAAEADAASAFLDPTRVGNEETESASFEVDEAAIASRVAALEEDAERARGYARELQGAEAAARAVAAQAHRAVGQYAGSSGAGFEGVEGHEGVGEGSEGVGDGHDEGHAHTPDAPVCAACLQPIDLTHRAHVLDRLKRDAETTAREHRRLLQSLRAAESEAVKAEQRRRDEMAAANRARADASARAAAAANRARDAQARLRAVRDARVNAHVVAAAMARAEALVAASPVAPVRVPTPSDANNLSGTTTVRNPGHSPQHMSGNAPALALVAAVETAVSDAERAFRQLETRSRDRSNAAATATANPHDMEVASLQSQADVEAAELEARREEAAAAEAALATAQRADSAFGTRGIQSYLFEGALGELSARVGDYMEALTGGALAMELRPAAVGEPNGGSTRRRRRGRAAAGDAGGADAEDEDGVDERGAPSVAAAEKIEKVIFAQSHDGERVQRSLRQLSGGERRRAALALALAHADLASARGGVGCDLLVLDEVLQHLDGEGIARVAALLRSLPKGTVLLTSQADSATSHLFDVVDRVFKKNGASGVATGCDAAFGTDEDEDEVAAVFS